MQKKDIKCANSSRKIQFMEIKIIIRLYFKGE